MALKDFKIERNFCDCHPETCCCSPYKLTYLGEVFAWNTKAKLEKLRGIIRDEVSRAKKKAVEKERNRVIKELGKTFEPYRDPFDY